MHEFQPYSEAQVKAIAEELQDLEGPLLVILHRVQATFGHVPREAVPVIANVLNLTRAEVHGVVTFYHDFRQEPPQGAVLKICRAEACQAMGGRALWDVAQQSGVAVEAVYCLGLCAVAPAAMLDENVHGRLDSDRLVALLNEAGR